VKVSKLPLDADHPDAIAFQIAYFCDELGLAQMLAGWLTRSGDFTHLGMVSSYPYSYDDKAAVLQRRVHKADSRRCSAAKLHESDKPSCRNNPSP